jgi:CTP synthase (UTP-ammonia lyase)
MGRTSESSSANTLNPRIVIVGDYDAGIHTHRAIDDALSHVRNASRPNLAWQWVNTNEVFDANLPDADGVWLAPASPYRSADGALLAIRTAREGAIPFLGVCGGFQHAIIEFARHQLGIENADHAETAPDAPELVIVPLSCALVGKDAAVFFDADSHLASIYGRTRAVEGYFCSYGLNPSYVDTLDRAGLRVVGRDAAGDVRAVELRTHPFFIATLFQPQLSSRAESPSFLVRAFVDAAAAHAQKRGIARPMRDVVV